MTHSVDLVQLNANDKQRLFKHLLEFAHERRHIISLTNHLVARMFQSKNICLVLSIAP